jgi:hypothetical protein
MIWYGIASATLAAKGGQARSAPKKGKRNMGLHGLNKIETKEIELETLDLYSESSYLLKTIEPLGDGLIMNTYLVDQEGLNGFFGSYGEHGEFVVELKRLEA